MKVLPSNCSDDELLAIVDCWAGHLEREDYSAAYSFTDHEPTMGWSANLIRDVIKAYGEASPEQRVTVQGRPTDISQRKNVTRWPRNPHGCVGEIWYDLNIEGRASDLTAIFALIESDEGLRIQLEDIHVM